MNDKMIEPCTAGAGDDSEVLALASVFWARAAAWRLARTALDVFLAELQARPDCPLPGDGQRGYLRWETYAAERGSVPFFRQCDDAEARMAAAAVAAFAVPARTPAGVLSKLRIAQAAIIEDGEIRPSPRPCLDLRMAQADDAGGPWVDKIAGDLARLADVCRAGAGVMEGRAVLI